MGFYLYKKNSFKKLNTTTFNLPERYVFHYAYEVEVMRVSELNLDGHGSALVESYLVEIAEFTEIWGRGVSDTRRDREVKLLGTSQYSIMSYEKLEELMLSPDWIVSDKAANSIDYPIETIMKQKVVTMIK